MNRRETKAVKSELYFKAFYYQQSAMVRLAKRNLAATFKRRAFDFYSYKQR